MSKNISKKFKSALVQFVIWLLLLLFVFIYLQSDKAEKQSIVSWPQILMQNIHVMFYNIFTDKWGFLQEKYSIQRTYDELLTTSKKLWCQKEYEEIKEMYNTLSNMSVNEYIQNSIHFRQSASNFSQKINDWCDW